MYYIYNGIDSFDGNDSQKFGIQNFGVATWRTDQLNGHLSKCQNAAYNGSYKTGTRFVINIGGYDWILASIMINTGQLGMFPTALI